MKKIKHPIGPRIAARRAEIGVSQDQLAIAIGMKQQGIASIEAGEVERPRKLKEIAAALRTTQDYLLTGKGKKEAEDDFEERDIDTPSRPASGIFEIDVRAGLGGGGQIEGREVRHDGDYADPVKPEAWQFPQRFMREEIRGRESEIIILETDGDSMRPTIESGERVIVHTGMKIPSPDGVFALRDTFGNIICKRLQVLRRGNPPRILVISDNPSHKAEEVGADEISIVGRVLYGLKRL